MTGISLNYFDVFGIKPLAGRVFDEKIDLDDSSKTLVINKATVTLLGFNDPQEAVGQFVLFGSKKTPTKIIGVVDDIRALSARENIGPMVYLPSPKATILTVRAKGDLAPVRAAIAQQWRHDFPNYALELDSLQSQIVATYEDDLRLSWLLLVASIVIGIISSLGIYVLSAYNLQRRIMEIALRKLFGADRLAILRLVGKEVLLILTLSALIGLPIAALGMSQYMANFVERAPVELPSMLIAFLLSTLVALVATLRTTLAGLRVAPAQALRE
jgi:putative ABC transport system permease protein